MTAATRADYSDWVIQAVCRHAPDDSVWHPESQNRLSTRMAKRICNGPDPAKHPDEGCPVREQCLAYALARGEHGIWGGTDDGQRRRMMDRRRAAG